ncbi:MAG: hypothetical protein M1483_03070, partial [Actinobacteria bacterium]|nr:hypothetical protein [Actinomycetota bacterium]
TFNSNAGSMQGAKLIDTPAIGALNGSGPPDVIVGTNEQYSGSMNANINLGWVSTLFSLEHYKGANSEVYAINPNGTATATTTPTNTAGYNPDAFLPGWPQSVAQVIAPLLPDIGDGVVGSPALASLSGNGQLQVGVMSTVGPAYILNPNGTSYLGTTNGLPNILSVRNFGSESNSVPYSGISVPALGSPIFAPLGSPSSGISMISPAISVYKALDAVLPADHTYPYDQVDAWNTTTGAFQAGFPSLISGTPFLVQPIVANVAQGGPYVVVGSSVNEITAVNAAGKTAPGFPKLTGGWMFGSPTFGAFGSLGTQVLAAGTREGNLFLYSSTTPASSSPGPWPEGHHDLYNTNNLETPSLAPTVTTTTTTTVPPPTTTTVLSTTTTVPTTSKGCIASPQCYWLTNSTGWVYPFGANYYGSMGDRALAAQIVGIASTPDGKGYWLVGADGGVFSFGDAGFYGSLPKGPGGLGIHPASSIVGIASTPDGKGYWLVSAHGGVFSFGDAGFYGSLPKGPGGLGIHPAASIVGIASTPDGKGYWLAGKDGGVFSFGDGGFYGSLPPGPGGLGIHPAASIVGIASTPDGKGYWLAGADGGVFSFGDSVPYGSLPAIEQTTNLNYPIVGIASTPDGKGYWLAGADGGVFSLGDAGFYGSLPSMGPTVHLNHPVVGVAGGGG